MSHPDFPRTIVEFQRHFPDDQACTEYLFASRWPEGFVCPRCGNELAWPVAKRRLVWECAACHRQTSVTAGTVLHKTQAGTPVEHRRHRGLQFNGARNPETESNRNQDSVNSQLVDSG